VAVNKVLIAAALLQGLELARMHLVSILDASHECKHFTCALDACKRIHSNVTYIAFELYYIVFQFFFLNKALHNYYFK